MKEETGVECVYGAFMCMHMCVAVYYPKYLGNGFQVGNHRVQSEAVSW